MKLKVVLFASVALVIMLVATFVATSKQPAQVGESPLAVPSATPTPHPDESLIRKLATDFINKWGTYSYQNFDAYAASIKPLVTDDVFQQYFGPARRPYKVASIQKKQYVITTTGAKVDDVRFVDTRATVRLTAQQTVVEGGIATKSSVRYGLTYSKIGSRYSVSDVALED